jgi:hypothetical protein
MDNGSWLRDTAERVVASFFGAFLTVLAAAGTDYVNVSTWRAAAIAGGAAVFSVLKAAVASRRADTVSPASLVKAA